MVQGQSGWFGIAVTTIPGVILAIVGWLAKRRIEGAQATALETNAEIDRFDKFVERLERDLARMDREVAKRDQQIADLKADLHLVESLLSEERAKRKKP